MKSSLKYLDNRLAFFIIAMFAASIIGRFVILGSAHSTLDQVRDDQDKASQELTEIERRVEGLRAQGADNLQDVVERISNIEQQLPAAPDELTLTVLFDNFAAASGVQLIEFGANPNYNPTARVESSLLKANSFTFSVSGTYDDVVDFIDRVLSSPTFLATFDSLIIRNTQSSSDNGGQSVFDGPVSLSGTVLLWSLGEPPILAGPDASTAPGDSTAPDATSPPDDQAPSTDPPATTGA